MTPYRSLSEADVAGKRVLVRIDHNIENDASGVLKNDEKIRASLPTVQALLQKNAKLIIMTHVGRPKGKVDPKLSTKNVALRLQELLPGVSVTHVAKTIGPDVDAAIKNLQAGGIVYLENVRFHPEEEGNSEQQAAFGKQLAALGEVYVNEAFPSCHTYEEASTCAAARLLPAYAGLRLEKEVEALSSVFVHPKHPITLIMSGAKMKTKIPVVEYFLSKGDHILLGGCIANTFVAAQGFTVGGSKFEPEFVDTAKRIVSESQAAGKAEVHVPTDVIVASAPDAAQVQNVPVNGIPDAMSAFDVGVASAEDFAQIIESSQMIIWNGPLGLYEQPAFVGASTRIAEAVATATQKGATSILGGGDTIDFHIHQNLSLDSYSFVSTGGGAMLEFLSGKPFPAIELLRK